MKRSWYRGAGRDLHTNFPFGHDPSCGETAVNLSMRKAFEREALGGQRLLGAMSGARVGGRPQILSRQNLLRGAPFRADVLSSAAINPYSIPSPPSHRGGARRVFSSASPASGDHRHEPGLTPFHLDRCSNRAACFGIPHGHLASAPLSDGLTRRRGPVLREIWTQSHACPYRYGPDTDNRLESVANVHTAADLHVRPHSRIALISRTAGAANDLKLHHGSFPATEMIQKMILEIALRIGETLGRSLPDTSRF